MTPYSPPVAAPTPGPNEVIVTLQGNVPLTLVKIPAGTFQMGSPVTEQSRSSDETQHTVTLSSDYYVGKTVVTQGQWQAVTGTAMSTACGSNGIGASFPVYCVSWDDLRGAGAFLDKLNAYLTSTFQVGAGRFRLPTEAEWERAARGGTQTRFSFGDARAGDDICGANAEADPYVWWCKNSLDATHPVGLKGKNAYGLFDVHGNVWEWVEDWYGSYPAGAVTDPTGPSTGSARVRRGGSWDGPLLSARSAFRGGGIPSSGRNIIGFRLARTQ